MNEVVPLQRASNWRQQIDELSEIVAGDSTTLGIYLAPKPRRLLGALVKHDLVTKDMAFTAMYFDVHVDDRPDITTVGVYLTHLRRFTNSHGIEIQTQRGDGWFITRSDKERLRAVIDGLKTAAPKRDAKKPGGIYAAARDEPQVDDNIPIPPKAESNRKYPWAKLVKVGQSIEVSATRSNVQHALQNWRKTHPEMKFETRNTPGGVRVWRIK